jgi:hypothetical protein
MLDRYSRVVLTVIALCLVYLCLVVSGFGTPLGAQQAGTLPQGQARPGLATGPAEVVIVGWRVGPEDPPVPVTVRNTVATQAVTESTTRVVIAGWEDRRSAEVVRPGTGTGFPVDVTAVRQPAPVVLVGTDDVDGAAWRRRVPIDSSRAALTR